MDTIMDKMYRIILLLIIMMIPAADICAVEKDSVQCDYFDSVEVSLLTCEPHDEVYSLYGHTAIRVRMPRRDNVPTADFAVNFGLFNSKADNFVIRFIFGLTDYMMGCVPYSDFLREYDYYGSAVYEQHLNLSGKEKQRFIEALSVSSQPENIVYRYNFFYNNCTTKARDLILSIVDGEMLWKQSDTDKKVMSFRDMIHDKVSDHPWTEVGNDLLLGFLADRNTTREEREFLPEILMEDFANAKVKSADGSVKLMVDSTSCVLNSHESVVHTGSFPLTPIQCAWLFMGVIMALRALLVYKFGTGSIVGWFDYAVSCLYATTGLVLFAMLFSQHPTVNANLQILVFNPMLYVLAYPRLKWKHGYVVVALLVVLFFAGNLVQHYAAGMNVMAYTLFLIALGHILQYKFWQNEKK